MLSSGFWRSLAFLFAIDTSMHERLLRWIIRDRIRCVRRYTIRHTLSMYAFMVMIDFLQCHIDTKSNDG
jgi:hypothetical protein